MSEEKKVLDCGETQQNTCPGLDPNCQECCDIAQDSCLRTRLGLSSPFLPENSSSPMCECHDICVQEVRLICPVDISMDIPFPPIGNCRLGPWSPQSLPTPGTKCDVFVLCAQERLLPDCSGIEFEVDLLIVCPANDPNPDTIIPVKIKRCCTSFFQFPPDAECDPENPFANPVAGDTFKKALQEIDGSQLLIQAQAEVISESNSNSIHIGLTGKIIDKLWQHVNLWVVGIRPYDFDPGVKEEQNIRSITIKEEFADFGHNIPDCDIPGTVPSNNGCCNC